MDQILEPTKNFGAYLDRTLKLIRQSYLQTFKEMGVNLTTEQWVLLDELYQNDGISQNELATKSFKNAPTVSRIIDLMCQKGLTERQRFDHDRRRYRIFLTTKGRSTYHLLKPAVDELREKGWNGLTDDDYQHFLRIMNQLFDNFKGR